MRGAERARLRKEAHGLASTLEVGKAGLSPTVVTELVRQLKTRPLVKVRIRKSAAGEAADAVARELASRSGSMLVEVRGGTAVYARGASSGSSD